MRCLIPSSSHSRAASGAARRASLWAIIGMQMYPSGAGLWMWRQIKPVREFSTQWVRPRRRAQHSGGENVRSTSAGSPTRLRLQPYSGWRYDVKRSDLYREDLLCYPHDDVIRFLGGETCAQHVPISLSSVISRVRCSSSLTRLSFWFACAVPPQSSCASRDVRAIPGPPAFPSRKTAGC